MLDRRRTNFISYAETIMHRKIEKKSRCYCNDVYSLKKYATPAAAAGFSMHHTEKAVFGLGCADLLRFIRGEKENIFSFLQHRHSTVTHQCIDTNDTYTMNQYDHGV